MRDFKGQHVSLLKSPCHDHQTVPIMVGRSWILADIPVEQAEKFVTM
jgi:hypothetical protein